MASVVHRVPVFAVCFILLSRLAVNRDGLNILRSRNLGAGGKHLHESLGFERGAPDTPLGRRGDSGRLHGVGSHVMNRGTRGFEHSPVTSTDRQI